MGVAGIWIIHGMVDETGTHGEAFDVLAHRQELLGSYRCVLKPVMPQGAVRVILFAMVPPKGGVGAMECGGEGACRRETHD